MSDVGYATRVDQGEHGPEDEAGRIPYLPVELMGKTQPPQRPASRLETNSFANTLDTTLNPQPTQLVGRQPGRREITIENIGAYNIVFGSKAELKTSNGKRLRPNDSQSLTYDGPLYFTWADITGRIAGDAVMVDFVALFDDGES